MATIRAGTIDDLKAVQQLNQQLFNYEEENKLHEAYDQEWPYAADGEKYFTSRLAQENGGVVFVAEDEGEVVGYLAAKYRIYSYRSENPIAEIENIFVEEDYRGQNVGTLLYEKFKKWCIENNVKRAEVNAAYSNHKAIKFYKTLGFSPASITLEQKLQ